MTVYVDRSWPALSPCRARHEPGNRVPGRMVACLPNHRWRWREACHLFPGDRTAAGLGELHALARRIGLRLEWYQERARLPHYDLTRGMRARAVAAGAVELADFAACRRLFDRLRAVTGQPAAAKEGGR